MKSKNRGFIITAILFVILISFVGISLLASTLFHIRILGARESKIKESSFLQSNLINYLHNLREEVYNANLNEFEFVETEFFNRDKFPDQIEASYIITNLFNNNIRYAAKYRSIFINDTVTSSNKKKKLNLEATINIDILSGNIPISAIPFYIDKKPESKESFLINNNINIDSTNFLTKIDTMVKFELDGFLIDSLGLNGKALNWKEIREKIGVEINDTPLKNGIYPFFSTSSEDKLDAVFIQGDVQKIIFSIEDKKQKLLITHENKEHLLEYIPDEYNLTWQNEYEESILFKEKIIVNGSIFSLICNGDFAFLKKTNLCIYSSGIVYIDSSLTSDSSVGSSLKIITGYNEFFKKPANSGRVIINKNSDNSPIRLAIAIIALEKIINNNKETIINGSIYTETLDNKGIINFSPYFNKNDIDPFFTTEKFTFIKDFIVSFNGEVYNE